MSLLMIPHTGFFWVGAGMCLFVAGLFLVAPLRKQWTKRTSLLAVIMGTALGGSSLFLYTLYGSLEGVEDKAIITHIAQRLSILQKAQTLSREKVLKVLQEIQTELPNRDVPWAYLAGVYQHLGFLDYAAKAYHYAFELNSNTSSYVTQEAYLRSKINQGLLPSELKMHLKTILQADAKNEDALTLLAMDAYQQQDYALAITYWQNLLKQAETLSDEERKSINLMLLKARQQV